MRGHISSALYDGAVSGSSGISRRAALGGMAGLLVGGAAVAPWPRVPWRRAMVEMVGTMPGGMGDVAMAYVRAQRHGKPVMVWLDGFPADMRRVSATQLELSEAAQLAPLALCERVYSYADAVESELDLDRHVLRPPGAWMFRGLLIETNGLQPRCVPCMRGLKPPPPPPISQNDGRRWRCGLDSLDRPRVIWRPPPAAVHLRHLRVQAAEAAIAIAPDEKTLAQRADDARDAMPRQRRETLERALANKVLPDTQLCRDAAAVLIWTAVTTSDANYKQQLLHAVVTSMDA